MATTGSWQLCTPSPWTDASPQNAPPKPISIPSSSPAASFPQLVAQPPKLRTPDLACCSSGSDSSCEISAFDADDDDEIIAADPMQPSCSYSLPNHRSLSPSSSSLSDASQHDTRYPLSGLAPGASPSTSSPSFDDDDDASYHSSHDLAAFLHQMSLPSSRVAFFCKDISFSPQLCWELADFISYSPSLRILTLSNCQLTDSLLEILLPFLASSVSIVTIDLPGNLLTDRGAALLADLVKDNPSSNICELQLGGNSIGDEGAAALASALASSRKLATLNLASNNITDAGCRALDRAVAAAGKMCTKTVQVSPGNNISAAAGAELARRTSGGSKRVLRLFSSLRG